MKQVGLVDFSELRFYAMSWFCVAFVYILFLGYQVYQGTKQHYQLVKEVKALRQETHGIPTHKESNTPDTLFAN